MMTILFVADNWNALDDIKEQMRPKRGVWRMLFACGANDAVRTIQHDRAPSFDVVVSELDMSGSDGIELLEQIHGLTPSTLRMLSSPDPTDALICASIPWIQSFIDSPIDLDILQSMIGRLLADPTAHRSHVIDRLIEPLDRLPVLPRTYERIAALSAKPDFAIAEIGAAVGADVALTAATLKLVNSTFFGLRTDVTSVEQAIGLLGLDVLKGLVLATEPIGSDTEHAGGLNLAALSEYCQEISALSRTIARHLGLPVREQSLVFLAGMVHCVGLLIAASNPSIKFPGHAELFAPVDLEVDERVFEIDRYALSAFLLRGWSFEPSIVKAVAGLAAERAGDCDVEDIAGVLALAIHLVGVADFSVADYIAADPDTVELVEGHIERYRNPTSGETKTAA